MLQWLTSIDMDFYGPVLEASAVDGQKLKSIKGESGFERLGIANYRDALMLWHSLQTLRESESAEAAADPAGAGAGAGAGSTSADGMDTGVASWSFSDIRKWLASCGQSHWEPTLATAGVTGDVLAGISNNVAFEKLGVTNPRDCMALYRALQSAKREAAQAKREEPQQQQPTPEAQAQHAAAVPAAVPSPEAEAEAEAQGAAGSGGATDGRVQSLVVPRMSDLGVPVTRVHEPVALPVSVSYVPTDASETVATHGGVLVGLDMDDTSQRAMLARTKKMLIDLLRQLPERTSLHDVIFTPPPETAERKHKAFVARVSMSEGLTERARSRAISVAGATLKQLQALVQANLKKMVQAGVVSEDDDYQALKNALALDIRHHALLRRDRRKEMQRLGATRAQLDGKNRALRERIQVYQKYAEQIASPGGGGGGGAAVGGGDGAAPPRPSRKPVPRKLSASAAGGAVEGGQDAIGGSGRFGTHKWTATKLKQRRALVSVAALPSVLPMKDIVVEVASYAAGEYRFSAMVVRGEFERATLSAEQLKAKAASKTGGAEILPGLTFNLPALFLLLSKKF